MSCKHPTHGRRTVPIELPAEQKTVLREVLFASLASTLGDLVTPERLRNPVAVAREGAIFARLLEAFDQGEIALPDEEARVEVGKIAAGFDKANAYRWVSATHDAHHALLDLLGGVGTGCAR